jgi:hypothetical protein
MRLFLVFCLEAEAERGLGGAGGGAVHAFLGQHVSLFTIDT